MARGGSGSRCDKEILIDVGIAAWICVLLVVFVALVGTDICLIA